MGLMHNEKGLIATPLRAFVALAVTGLLAAQNVYAVIAAKHSVKALQPLEFIPIGFSCRVSLLVTFSSRCLF